MQLLHSLQYIMHVTAIKKSLSTINSGSGFGSQFLYKLCILNHFLLNTAILKNCKEPKKPQGIKNKLQNYIIFLF